LLGVSIGEILLLSEVLLLRRERVLVITVEESWEKERGSGIVVLVGLTVVVVSFGGVESLL
jgi:hypothetical protein